MSDPAVLFERSGVVALEKPWGLATQAPAGIPSVEAWLRARLGAAAYLGVPHRLDRAVSGVILMATTPRAARQLSRQFERRWVRKSYLALVAPAGAVTGLAGPVEWRDRIAKVADAARGRVVEANDPSGRDAVTLLRSISAVGPAWMLLELEPLTGRMHQLRLQSAHRGMPVVGDGLYGGPCPTAEWCDPPPDMDGSGPQTFPIALHARRICYRDPDSGEDVVITAPLPSFWPAAAGGVCAAADPIRS
ncbi:MAG: RluA family pseudouridine synthase [Planctomycetota bacterium]|nr:MAG: RluA family pseudouridine synthase [Planctomycetota bacterium]